jgi:hypothetical protein
MMIGELQPLKAWLDQLNIGRLQVSNPAAFKLFEQD